MFATWGRFVYRFRWPVLILSILSLAGWAALMSYSGTLGAEDLPSQTEAGRANELIESELGRRAPSFILVFSSDDSEATDQVFREEAERALGPLRDEPQVTSIRTAYDDNAASSEEMISRDGRSTYAVVELEDAGEAELREAYPGLREQVTSDSLEVLTAGALPLNQDFDETAEGDLFRAEVVSLPLALMLLIFVFGSLVAAGMPLGVGALAVFGGFVGTLLLARLMDVSIYATNIVTMIGLGVAIDYSLFVVSRFREEVSSRPVPEALSRTMATAGRAITFSGLTVAIGLLGLLFFDLYGIDSMGVAGTIVVALSVFYGLTFLPALLAVLGPRVNALRLPFVRPEGRTGHGLWPRLARAVMARPWRVLLPVTALLILLGSPVLHLKLSLGDHTVLPERSESRRGAELLKEQFPAAARAP